MGEIILSKENNKNESRCYQTKEIFNYHGIEKALCGKTGRDYPFTPKRIFVIQMIEKENNARNECIIN